MCGEFVVSRMEDTFEEEFFEAFGIEIRFDNGTFIDHIFVFHCLILPLDYFANVEAGQIACLGKKRTSDEETNLRLQDIDDTKEEQNTLAFLIDSRNTSRKLNT
jgi:hypothetical protein